MNQELVIASDRRQATEKLIQCGMAIATGPTYSVIDDSKSSGVTVNVPKFVFADAITLAGGSVWIFLFKEAPRFNAAKLFINWLVIKVGQTIWNQMALQEKSRSAGVAPNGAPGAGAAPMSRNTKQYLPENSRFIRYALLRLV